MQKEWQKIQKSACNFQIKMLKYHPAWMFHSNAATLSSGRCLVCRISSLAKKRVLVSEARNARNKANRSALKTAIKKFEAAAVEGNRTEAEGAYKVAVKSIDKAALPRGLLAQEQRCSQEECADAETQPDWLIQTKGHLPGVLFLPGRRKVRPTGEKRQNRA